MNLPESYKLVLNGITVIIWIVGIIIGATIIMKRKQMKDETGVSCGTYLGLIAFTEVIYTVGAVMVLAAMGVNVLQHLAKLELWKFYSIVSKVDMSTIKVIGVIGWIGFAINRSISYVTPGYLLIRGGRKLPKYFFYSAWAEVTLETVLTVLIFISLKIQ